VIAASGAAFLTGSLLQGQAAESRATPAAPRAGSDVDASTVKNMRAFDGAPSEAPTKTLLKRGPFKVTVRCYFSGGTVGTSSLISTRAGAVSDAGGYDGTPTFVPKGDGVELTMLNAGLGQSGMDEGAAKMIRGDTAIHASVTMFIKNGALPDGNGTYGKGQRCIFHGVDLGTG
jgi:hypothetical protein